MNIKELQKEIGPSIYKDIEKHIKDTIEDELADAFIRLLDTAEGWGIDLQEHVKLKMLYNAKRERLHGNKY